MRAVTRLLRAQLLTFRLGIWLRWLQILAKLRRKLRG
jgi:hypothetical protein